MNLNIGNNRDSKNYNYHHKNPSMAGVVSTEEEVNDAIILDSNITPTTVMCREEE